MKNVQEILDTVIDKRYYSNDVCNYMCISAKLAKNGNDVTRTEYAKVIYALRGYVGSRNTNTLSTALMDSDLPFSYDDKLSIYRNWDNRPELKVSE